MNSTKLANKCLIELESNLPRIAKILETDVTNLNVFTNPCSVGIFYGTEDKDTNDYKDIELKRFGLSEDLPPIQGAAKNNKRFDHGSTYGIRLYKNRLNPTIKYVVYKTFTEHTTAIFVITKKGEAWKLMRSLLKGKIEYSKEGQKPILPDGLLDSIVNETIQFIKDAKKYKKYGVKPRRGILLTGPPGNGKTFISRYLKRLCVINSISCCVSTSSEIEKKYNYNELHKIFEHPISFLDDIDLSFLTRKSGGDTRKACALLAAMDGMLNESPHVTIFTTNENIDDLDPAFMRPGRIDKVINIGKPDTTCRYNFFKLLHEDILNEISINDLVYHTDNMSFAQLEYVKTNLVQQFLAGKDCNLSDVLRNMDYKPNKNSIGF